MNMDNEALCREFLKYPNINPKTGKRLVKDKGPYNKYVDMCRDLGYDEKVENMLGSNAKSIKTSAKAPKSKKSVKSPKPSNAPKTISPEIIRKGILGSDLGLTGLSDIDKEIILNANVDAFPDLLKLDNTTRKLVIRFLPNIIKTISNSTFTNLLYH